MKSKRLIVAILALTALTVGAWACQPVKKGSAGSGSGSAKVDPVKALTKGAPAKINPAAISPSRPKAPPKPVYHSGAHILIAYKGAMRAKPVVTRSKEQAKKLATELAAKLRKDPAKFDEFAKKHSDGPSGASGGDLGTWPKGKMVPAFDKAIEKMKVGEISDPVETPFGFHVIIRKAVLPEVRMGATQILITYKGSLMGKDQSRSKAAAKKLAEKIAKQAKAAPDTFLALVAKHSEGPAKARKGKLPDWSSRDPRMPALFTKTVRKLKVNEVSDAIESRYGFHIFKRLEPSPIFAGAHVLIAYKGAQRAGKTVTRSKDEAKSLAKKLAKQLKAAPGKFTEIAAKHSDGPSAAQGGRLGKWPKGRMVPAFDAAIAKLKFGEISDPVESPFGFHIIRRDDPKTVTR